MKITLISPYPDITSFGVRTISAFLKENGHDVQLIFLPDPHGDELEGITERYEVSVLADVVSLCQHSELVGISLMTNFFDGAVQITAVLKKRLKTPILWGGIHPTVRPDECLDHADIVCIGEAEDSLLILLNRMAAAEEYWHTENFWFKRPDGIVRNALKPLPSSLDVYPPPDYSCIDHHVMYNGKIVPLTHDVIKELLSRGTVSEYLGRTGYQTMTSRGCPYNCSYCINHTIMQMYGGKGKLRWRSVDHVMAELVWVKENMPFVDYIWISDDEFMARKTSDIEYFCQEYKKKIDLPFSCLVSALSITEKKLAMLVEAGLIYVQMGVESGSARMQKQFMRGHINNEKMMKAITLLNTFKDRMFPPSYDFLLDVPGETDEDRIDSLRFIADIPKPYRLQPFTLILYPGTHLYNLAMEQGIIKDERKEIYNKTYAMYSRNYLNMLFSLAKNGKFPSLLLKIAITPPAVMIFNSRILQPIIAACYGVLRASYRAMKSVIS